MAESMAISWTHKGRVEEKDARLGTVNSVDRKKPKYPRLHAAPNIQWSRTERSRDLKITIISPSVISVGKKRSPERA